MLPLQRQLQTALEAAVRDVIGAASSVPLLVVPVNDPKFGDLQCSSVLGLAKTLKRNPRELAQQIAAKTDVSFACKPPEIAGAGFINFRLKPEFIARQVAEAAGSDRVGVAPETESRTFVIDFSSPNVSKQMHVGHIRSTILGDAIARMLRFVGHRVITDNHIGDWGTDFGMRIVGWKKHRDDAALARDPTAEIERLYKLVRQQSDANPQVLDEARRELAKLQSGDAENLAIWQKMRELSQSQFDAIYARLGVQFDHTLGESFYNPRLKQVVAELKQKGIAEDSEGAVCVFFPGDKELKDKPFLIQKSDGAALYATTDLATIQYRIEQWHPDEIIYVTDARQQLHFKQLFAVARRWGVTCGLRHVFFGSILGDDGKPFKARSGENVKLAELLDEAESRALAIVNEKNSDLSESARKEIAREVGIGAVKYADLCQNRITDYVFSWDKMLAMQGNTAPYLQYAYVRIRSIFRKGANGRESNVESRELRLGHSAELDLAKHLLNFDWALQQVLDDYKPSFLCSYLYEVSVKFNSFYENCPVLQSDEPTRSSRLVLCELTAAVLKKGLNLLGIETIEQM
jgi:arginyl-tRNA synthetase